jgi:hypothetical protein
VNFSNKWCPKCDSKGRGDETLCTNCGAELRDDPTGRQIIATSPTAQTMWRRREVAVRRGIVVVLLTFVVILAYAFWKQEHMAVAGNDDEPIGARGNEEFLSRLSAGLNQDASNSIMSNASEAEAEVGDLVEAIDETQGIEGPNNDAEKLMGEMPFFSEHFSVEYVGADNSFIVKLYAICNHEWQYEQYRKDLTFYKEEALYWIASKGADPNKLKIQYLPEV